VSRAVSPRRADEIVALLARLPLPQVRQRTGLSYLTLARIAKVNQEAFA